MRQEPALTELAFHRLLTWLDDGVHSDGETYLEMRRRLVAYFDRRNRLSPEELADDTLNRIALTLERSGEITVSPPARYCYVVARFVFLEDLRRRENGQVSLDPRGADTLPERRVTDPDPAEEAAMRERRLDCLEQCLDKLEPAQRDLILAYYRGTGREKIEARRELAKQLGITMNALSIRASRIRDALERCVASCCEK